MKFRTRAENWKNVFDTSIGFARGKDSKGRWLEPFDAFAFGHETTVIGCFTEGNSFQYSWHVMHDVSGLVAAMGGRGKVERNSTACSRNRSRRDSSPVTFRG